MTTATTPVAHDLERDRTGFEPTVRPDAPAPTQERPDARPLHPTDRRRIGADPYEDPTQGRTIGSDPYDDPTQGRTIGSRPEDDPLRPR
jgi:hypothetical protein